jgi:hypothetical protein
MERVNQEKQQSDAYLNELLAQKRLYGETSQALAETRSQLARAHEELSQAN